MTERCKIVCANCLDVMATLPDGEIDLTVTSPPYDNLRNYNGFTFDFEPIAKELFRVTKPGGVVVWVVGDATVKGSETGTSFRQALFFKECGFNLHDTMIWQKAGFSAVGALRTRYAPVFDYMFVFCKGALAAFNPIKDRINVSWGRVPGGTVRQKDGSTKPVANPNHVVPEYGQRFNVWNISAEMRRDIKHPAPFPEALARDHITTWSNENDLVFDPFLGSGTTAKAALHLNRRFIGTEISEEYAQIARQRVEAVS